MAAMFEIMDRWRERHPCWPALRVALLAAVLATAGCVVNPVPTPGDEAADYSKSTTNIGGGGSATSGADAGAAAPPQTADPDESANDSDGNKAFAGLGQAGAQDFGLFRSILEAGQVPGPGTIDDVGFFAEHKLDYPAPKCGQQVCGHGLLGEMGNLITGSTCTLVQLGLNTPLDVSKLKRPPLHAVLALDRSLSMQGAPLDHVKVGVAGMIDGLKAGDRVSVVAFSNQAEVLLEAEKLTGGGAGKQAVQDAMGSVIADGKTNLYDGLFQAYALAASHHVKGMESRVILLSDGAATTGLSQPGKLVSLAAGWAKKGIGITTIGLGSAVDLGVLRDLAEVGGGSFHFVDKPAAVEEIFVEQSKTFMVPVALDVRIDVEIGDGWVVGGVYGTNGWKGTADAGLITIPSLFLAGRTDASKPLDGPPGTGRRGGGGAILLELMPLQGVVDGGPWVTRMTLRWVHPTTAKEHVQVIEVKKGWSGQGAPPGGWFSGPTVEKGFVMLNIYAGFKLAAELAADGDPGAAKGVLIALRDAVETWLADPKHSTPDPDIDDDLKYVDLFLSNLAGFGQQTPISKPPEPWPVD